MHFFTVGAIFRNESHGIVEWIEHYLKQGANHFYLINDSSTDNSVELLEPYIIQNKITLYHTNQSPPHPLGYQRNMYNQFILPNLRSKATQWLLMCDIDEYVYSPIYKTIPDFLRQGVPGRAQIQVTPTLFGSNGLEKQPSSVVQGFTKRSRDCPTKCGTYKYFVNSDFEFESLNVHHATSKNPEHNEVQYFMLINMPYLKLNHYINQSKEFWIQTKCTRGDADGFLTRDMSLFDSYEAQANEEDDFELALINKVNKCS